MLAFFFQISARRHGADAPRAAELKRRVLSEKWRAALDKIGMGYQWFSRLAAVSAPTGMALQVRLAYSRALRETRRARDRRQPFHRVIGIDLTGRL
jgi:hypothetical protein